MAEKLTIKNMSQAEGALAEMSAISRKLSLIEGPSSGHGRAI